MVILTARFRTEAICLTERLIYGRILAVRAHGLGAGPIIGFDPAGVDAAFFPDRRWHAILVVNIGHPGENAWRERLPRLDHDEVIRWA